MAQMLEETDAQFILVGRGEIASELKKTVKIERPPTGDSSVREEKDRSVQLELSGQQTKGESLAEPGIPEKERNPFAAIQSTKNPMLGGLR